MDTFKPTDKNVVDQNFFLVDKYVNKLQGGDGWIQPNASNYGRDYTFFNPTLGDIPCVCLKTPDGSGYQWVVYDGGEYTGPFGPLIMPVGPFEKTQDAAGQVKNAETVDANFAMVEAQYQRRNASRICPFPASNLRYWKWQHQTDTGDKFVICCKKANGTYYWKGPITPPPTPTIVPKPEPGQPPTPVSGKATAIYVLVRLSAVAHVVKLDKVSGSSVWETALPVSVSGARFIETSNLHVDAAAVYVVQGVTGDTSSELRIHKLNAVDGSIAWSRTVSGFQSLFEDGSSGNIWSIGSPVIDGDKDSLYLAGRYVADGGLGDEFMQVDKYSKGTGALLWSVTTSGDVYFAAVDAANSQYVVLSDPNGAHGVSLYSKDVGALIRQSAAHYDVAHYYQNIYATNIGTGYFVAMDLGFNELAQILHTVPAFVNFIVDGSGISVAKSNAVTTYDFTGNQLMNASFNPMNHTDIGLTAIAVDKDSLYVLRADDGSACRLSRTDGHVIWSYPPGSGRRLEWIGCVP